MSARTNTPEDRLLGRAQEVLRGDVALPRGQSSRIAAWFVRSALEQTMSDRLATFGIHADRATARTRIASLRIVDPDLAPSFVVAWDALSRCCHHHAYELAPSAEEIQNLLRRVYSLRSAMVADRDRA